MPRKNATINNEDKRTRRSNGEGTVYYREDKDRWYGEVLIGYKTDGTPIKKYPSGKTESAVRKKVRSLTSHVEVYGHAKASARKNQNLEALMREWYDLKIAPFVGDITKEKHRSFMLLRMFPALGSYDVKDIDGKQLQKFFNDMMVVDVEGRKGYSSDSLAKMKSLLNRFFDFAVDEHYASANPMKKVRIEKPHDSKEIKEAAGVLPKEVKKAVLEFIDEHSFIKPILVTFLYTGIRPSELLALKWSSISFTDGFVTIKEAVKRKSVADFDWNVTGRSVGLGPVKTVNGFRTIPLEATALTFLSEWKQYCEENGVCSEFVFPVMRKSRDSNVGDMRKYSGLRSLLTRFIQKHGLQDEKITWYTLRREFATTLLENGVTVATVQHLMGHSKPEMTMKYSRVRDGAQKAAISTLENEYATLLHKKAATPHKRKNINKRKRVDVFWLRENVI